MITTTPSSKNWRAQKYQARREVEDAFDRLTEAHENLAQVNEARAKSVRLSIPVHLLDGHRECVFDAMLEAHKAFTKLHHKFIEDYGKPYDSEF